jgi:hypothetical protein
LNLILILIAETSNDGPKWIEKSYKWIEKARM